MSYGFEITVDQKILDNLEKVDNSIAKIATTSRETADKVNKQFTAMATGGIENFLSALNKVNTNINTTGLSNFTASLQGVDRGIDNTTTMTSELVRTISLLNNRIQDLQKPLPNATLIDISKTREDLEELGFDLDGLRQQMTALKRMRTENKNFLFDETQKENAKILTAEIRTLGKEIDKLSLAEKAMKKFNSAMALGEATVTQRTRKIQRLSEVQKILNTDSNKYKKELNEIRLAQERLNKAQNDSLAGIEKVRKSQSQLLNTTQQLARQAALYFSVSQIQGYIQKLAQVRGQFELQQKSLQAIMQDKEQADRVFAQVVDLSVRSPFRLSELVSYTKQLAAYRVENEKVFDVTKMLADVSAGLGVDMSRLILAYGQVKAANYLRGTELRQFSEAGINILGELRQYFAETRGEMYSTAEVFEMVSKRMISFGDVEAVFQRLTSAGGIFYNMQEIQAETLIGQISNLGDAIDVMLNKIGQTNEGALKGGISAVRTVVENYQYLEIALKAILISFGTYTSMVALATIRNRGFASSSIEATIAQGGLAKGLAKTVAAFRNFGTFLKANPIMLAVTAIATGLMLVKKRFDDLEESAKFYDVLTKSVQKSRTEHDKLVKSIEANNKAISDSEDIINNYTKGTEEYIDAERLANSARENQIILLEELKTKFPDVYNGLETQKNGVIDLTEAQALLNEQLRQTNTLNYLFSETGTFWTEDINLTIKSLEDLEVESRLATGKVDNAYQVAVGNINKLLDSNANFSKKYKDQINQIFDSSDDIITKVSKLRNLFTQDVDGDVSWWNRYVLLDDAKMGFEAIYSAYEKLGEARSVITDGYRQEQKLLKTLNPLIESYRNTIDLTTKAGREQSSRAIEAIINSLNIQEKAVRDLVAKQFEIRLGVKLNFDGTPKNLDITFLEEQINKYVSANNITLSAELKFKEDDTAETYFSRVLSSIKELRAEENNLSVATEQLYEDIANKDKADQIDAQADALTAFAKAFGFLFKETQRGDSTKTQLELELDLLDKLNKEYEKLRQNYNAEEAHAKTMQSYELAIAEIRKKNPNFLVGTDISLDDSGIYSIYEKMEDAARKAGGDTWEAFQKAFGAKGIEIEITASLEDLENISNKIDNLFESYKLTIDMESLGFDTSAMKDLFNFDAVSLDSLQKQLDKIFATEWDINMKNFDPASLVDQGKISEAELKIYKDTQTELSKMYSDRLKDDSKELMKWLVKSKSDREKLEEETQKSLAAIDRMNWTDEAKKTAKSNVEQNYQRETAALNFEDIKQMELYSYAFENLDRVGDATINHLLSILMEFKNSAAVALNPEVFNEVMTAIKKLRDESEMRNPFGSIIDGYKEYIAARKDYNKAIEDGDTKEEAEAQNRMANALAKAQNGLKSSEEYISNYSNAVSNAVDLVYDFAEGMGLAVDPETEAILDGITKGFQAMVGVLSLIVVVEAAVTAGGIAMQAALWPLLAIGAALGAIFALVSLGDAKKQKEIDKELGTIEKLEKAYESLQESFESESSIREMEKMAAEMEKNVQAQIDALNRAIAAEEDKKKTDSDQIKEWKEQQEELLKQQEDFMNNDFLEGLGGIGRDDYKSMTEDFISAWEDAFLEVGEGTDVIEEKLEELVMNMIRSKAMSQFADAMLSDFYEQINKAAEGGLTPAEMDKLMDEIAVLAPELNEALKALYEQFGIVGGATSDLSELQKGIQSITEPTGQALESLLNSIRFEVFQQTGIQREIAASLLAIKLLMSIESPIHRELVNQTSLLTNIRDDIRSIIKQGGSNGAYIQTNL